MTSDRWDALLEPDWAEAWERLPEAPPLVPRRKTAQITLRLPRLVIARLKRVAAARSLPYHALARSWIVDGLRAGEPFAAGLLTDEPQAEQLNVKLGQGILDGLKTRAHEVRVPYHRLARGWIEAALAREEENLQLVEIAPSVRPAIKDIIVLLLHTTNKHGQDAVRGITRLQKLLFVIEQNLAIQSDFYAFNYGPFNEQVNDAAHALGLAGFLRGGDAVKAQPPSFADMLATVVDRSGPRKEPEVEEYALNEQGHAAAERLRQSNAAYDRLYAYVHRVREEWDTPDLLERVYQTWPKYTERSLIRDEVARRARRRKSQ
jgi:predicted DNA binding CopG/RHH family protein